MTRQNAKNPGAASTASEVLDFDRADTWWNIDSAHTVELQTNNLTSRLGLTPAHARVVAELAFGRAAA